jgi:hypothetical protein
MVKHVDVPSIPIAPIVMHDVSMGSKDIMEFAKGLDVLASMSMVINKVMSLWEKNSGMASS